MLPSERSSIDFFQHDKEHFFQHKPLLPTQTRHRLSLSPPHVILGLIEKNFHLHRASRDAYRSYIHAYEAHSLKDCFEVSRLDFAKVARSFGFAVPPKVELNIKHRQKKGDKKKAIGGGQHGKFSAENPYGKRDAGDKRQFMH